MAGRSDRKIRKKEADFILLFTTMTLLAIGIVMVFSASYYILRERSDPYYHLRRQVQWAALGLAGMLFFSNYDYWKLKRWTNLVLLLSFIMLVAVFIPGIGEEILGARRWIRVGVLTFQPSDLAKVALIMFAAAYLSRRDIEVQKFTEGPLPILIIMGIFFAMIMKQPDLGTGVAMAGSVMLVIFVAGMPLQQLALIGASAVPMLFYLIYSEPYRLQRLMSFRDPWADPLDTGYQIIQSLYAIGPGGLFGVGLGQGRQKMHYLPEPHSDFIFAVISEELGFIGASTVLIIYFLLFWRGIKIALSAPDAYGSLLATGIISMIGLQTLMNIGVVTGSIPVTGINLPLISSGGSSLLFTMCSLGVLLNISKYAK
ncbi:MAG TPA: stage V sporulation protein E [Oscillospiraceae bacterium]|nr:stage V sporulation protein E [Oscillospiraceae bacterium]